MLQTERVALFEYVVKSFTGKADKRLFCLSVA